MLVKELVNTCQNIYKKGTIFTHADFYIQIYNKRIGTIQYHVWDLDDFYYDHIYNANVANWEIIAIDIIHIEIEYLL